MRFLTKITMASLGTIALATVVFACDKDGDAAKMADKGAGCPHAAAAKAAAEKGEGCAHAKGAMAEKASYKDAAGGCMFHSEASESQRAALEKGSKVTMVGEVVCAHCDLSQAKECKSVFRAENGTVYAIVPNDASEKLKGVTMHGEKKVEIEGTAAKDADESIVLLTSYKLVS